MRNDSLKLIEEVVQNFAKLTSIEISGDSIYLEFIDVELGVPKSDDDLSLSMRFAKNSFISLFLLFAFELYYRLCHKSRCRHNNNGCYNGYHRIGKK